jgi:hypothetical protein
VAWQFAVGGDLSLPQVEGHRPLAVRLSNKYIERLQTAAETDRTVAEQFARVVALVDKPTSLLRPNMLRRAVRPQRRQQRAAERVLTPT